MTGRRAPRRVFLTGASGLIGGELAGALTERGHSVLAFVHRNKEIVRNDGTPVSTRAWTGGPPAQGAVELVEGDLAEPGFGLNDDSIVRVAESADLIIHSAAITAFGLDAVAYDYVNVGGTANVLALAGAGPGGPIPVLHVSTAYVCGERSGPVYEDELDVGQSFANAYEVSKAAAEWLVAQARAAGVPVAVARPSIVVGAGQTGAIRAFDIYLLLKLAAEGRISVLPATPKATLDLVPIDYVVSMVLKLAERIEDIAGQTFHLVSGDPVPLDLFARVLSEYEGLAVPTIVSPHAFNVAALPAAEQRLQRRVVALYESYFRRDPRFMDVAASRIRDGERPATGAPLLRALIEHCLREGYIQAAAVPARGAA